MRNNQNFRIILVSIVLIFLNSTFTFATEDCPKQNLKARMAYDSAIFWSGRGDYQKAYGLLEDALKICPNYSSAISKKKEIATILLKHQAAKRIEEEKRLQAVARAKKEAEERRKYEEHLRREKERVFREAKEREEYEKNPKCTQDEMWKYVINNAYRLADENAMLKNRSSTFIVANIYNRNYTFTKQSYGKYKGKYLLKITNKHGNKTSVAKLLPLFDVNQSSKGLDDEKPLWRVVSATLNGRSY